MSVQLDLDEVVAGHPEAATELLLLRRRLADVEAILVGRFSNHLGEVEVFMRSAIQRGGELVGELDRLKTRNKELKDVIRHTQRVLWDSASPDFAPAFKRHIASLKLK